MHKPALREPHPPTSERQPRVLPARSRGADWHPIGILLLLAVETAVFYWTVTTGYSPYYPANYDQLSYFGETYVLLVRAHREGWWTIFGEYVHPIHANGIGFTVQGALLGLLSPSRTAIISINLIYFAALQLVLFLTVRARTNRPALAWIAVGLVLSCGALYVNPGGIYDYRIDFAAMCLYGVWCCCLVRSRVLLHTSPSAIAGGVGAMVGALRYFTVAYLGIVLAGLLVFALFERRYAHSALGRRIAFRRVRNAVLAGMIILVVVLPIIYLSKDIIYSYYVVGHVLSEEKYIRARELGLDTIFAHLAFYPRSIYTTQLGWWARLLILGLLAMAGVHLAFAGRGRDFLRGLRRYRAELLVSALAIVAPIVVLTGNIAKSPVVANITVVPIVLFVVFFLAAARLPDWSAPPRLVPVGRLRTGDSAPGVGLIAAAVAFFVGFHVFLVRGTDVQHNMPRAELEKVTRFNETIADYVIRTGQPRTVVSFDRVSDFVNYATIRLFGFERTGKLVDLHPNLGHGIYGIFATPREVALKLVEESDIIVLTDPVIGRENNYPINTRIREYWSELQTWTEQHRSLLASAVINGIPHRAYVREFPPKAPPSQSPSR